jgi:hypothetical protein
MGAGKNWVSYETSMNKIMAAPVIVSLNALQPETLP